MRKDDVLGLDVPVEDGVLVHVLECDADFVQFGRGLLERQGSVFFQVRIQRASLHELHQDVKMGPVVEEGVEFDDVGMVEEELDLDFLDELVEHMFDAFLLDFLEGEEPARSFVSGGENFAESSRTQAPTENEVVQRQTIESQLPLRGRIRQTERTVVRVGEDFGLEELQGLRRTQS